MKFHFASAFLLLSAMPAAAQMLPGDPDMGRGFAQRLCADCHVIGREATGRAADGAPTFISVARKAETTEVGLRVFLQTPHSRMPNLALTRSEINDVVSYILSLR